MQIFVILGSINAFLAVGLGAFGAHGLKSRVAPELLVTWQTGVQYHIFHALGLILIGILIHLLPQAGGIKTAGWLLMAGTLLFSGSLYVLVLSGVRGLGAITPIGGVAFLVGWLVLAFSVWRAA